MPRKKDTERKTETPRIRTAKRSCFYCGAKLEPTYTDVVTLRKFVSDRSKIIPKLRSGACSKHQRAISKQVKYARFLALLPFVTPIH